MLDYSTLLVSGVYLIHAHRPLHHARHYIGFSTCIANRIILHRKGEGSKLIRAFNRNGITWEVARIWEGETRDFERKLHNGKNSVKWLCPICRQEAVAQRLQIVSHFNEPVATLDLFTLSQEAVEAVTPL